MTDKGNGKNSMLTVHDKVTTPEKESPEIPELPAKRLFIVRHLDKEVFLEAHSVTITESGALVFQVYVIIVEGGTPTVMQYTQRGFNAWDDFEEVITRTPTSSSVN